MIRRLVDPGTLLGLEATVWAECALKSGAAPQAGDLVRMCLFYVHSVPEPLRVFRAYVGERNDTTKTLKDPREGGAICNGSRFCVIVHAQHREVETRAVLNLAVDPNLSAMQLD